VILKILVDAWSLVTVVAAVISLPGTLELFGLSAAALLPIRRPPSGVASGPWRVAVVVPAHNEALSIASCVESLLLADKGDMQVTVYVIADNCTDNTAELAVQAGATVLRRSHATERGKGYALHFAFTRLEAIGFDCALIVDADTTVAPNFITSAAEALRNGAAGVQVQYLARNAEASAKTRLQALAIRAFNVVRQRGRQNLGLSTGILGNGFGLRRDTLAEVPYLASSVVEDLEYHIALVRSGRKIVFVNDTAVFGELPTGNQGAQTQRSRWEGGRFRMLFERAPGLFLDVLKGRFRCFEPMMELLLLPLAFHVVLLVVAALSQQLLVREVALAGIAVVLLHLLVTVVLGKGGWRDVQTLAGAPFYILWKLLLLPSLFRNARAKNAWVRTTRNQEVDGD
jgi:cellulose synthase/poly-beta-1,6-N-acetylglucosamine synthase-like glycosyltransferase